MTTVKQFVKNWPSEHDPNFPPRIESLFMQELRNGLSTLQIEKVLRTIDETCNHCWDSLSNCTCMRDE